MTRLKLGILSILLLAPVVALCGFGAYHLWAAGWSFIAWFPIASCFAVAYFLAWYWAKQQVATLKEPPIADGLPKYWTTRDRTAWQAVNAFISQVKPLSADDTANVERYAHDAQEMAMTLVKLERPNAQDPFGHLTIPEILTCCELVTQEMHDLTVQYIPGSHLIRVDDMKLARKAVDWYQTSRNAYWAASAVINPITTAVKFLATKVGLQTPFEQLRNTALQWFYTTYLQQLGRYLIELNSGRLKVGAKRYRELLAAHQEPKEGETAAEPTTLVRPVQIAILGQVKAGKSSLVNALVGETRAGVAVTPETDGATKYVLAIDDKPSLILVDSAGYGLAGVTDRDVQAALDLAKQSDMILLVAHARSAARKFDVEFVERLRTEFETKRGLILPPIVVALTHIDLLTPAVEWQPPYDWKSGDRPKEKSIRDAVTSIDETFPNRVTTVVPVCTMAGKEYGVQDHLLTALLSRLGEARGVAIVRMLEAESATRPMSRLGSQLLAAGKKLYQKVAG